MQHFSPYLLSESPLEVRPPSLLGGLYAAGRTSPRSGPEGRALYAEPCWMTHTIHLSSQTAPSTDNGSNPGGGACDPLSGYRPPESLTKPGAYRL